MTAPRDPDVLIRAFLDEGETDLPDRTFDAVRHHIHQTRQRVVIGPWREPVMSNVARMAIAVAAVVAVAFAWVNFGPSRDQIGSTPTPTPTVPPSPRPIPASGELEPGRYEFSGDAVPGSGGTPLGRITVTVPSGWTSYQGVAVDKNYGPSDEQAGASFVLWQIQNRYVDPCTNHKLLDPIPGPGVDELVGALAGQPGVEAGPPTDVTVDGYRGKFVELTVTTDLTTCGGATGFWLWGDPTDHRFVQGNNEMDRIYVLDVDGVRRTFFARFPAMTTAADRAELEAIIASVDIQP